MTNPTTINSEEKFASNSETSASELLENLEEMFSLCYQRVSNFQPHTLAKGTSPFSIYFFQLKLIITNSGYLIKQIQTKYQKVHVDFVRSMAFLASLFFLPAL